MLLLATGVLIVAGVVCLFVFERLRARGVLNAWLRPTGIVLLLLGVIAGGGYWAKYHPMFAPAPTTESGAQPEPFALVALLPGQGESVPQNFALRAVFNRALDPTTATALRVTAADGTAIAGAYHIENEPGLAAGTMVGSIVFHPLGLTCPKQIKNSSCVKTGTYQVNIDANRLTDSAHEHIICDADHPCTFSLTVEATEETAEHLTANSNIVLPLLPSANLPLVTAVRTPTYVRVIVDQGQVGERVLGVGVVEPKQTSVAIDVSALPNNTTHLITIETEDAQGTTHASTSTIGLMIAHCVNKQQDEDETGKDCGGKDCMACKAL